MVNKEKWKDIKYTADGSVRAVVPFTELKTLWLNTGTICNLACANCYIESSPQNDSLVFLTLQDTIPYVEEILSNKLNIHSINITGGEPFINPEIFSILEYLLKNSFQVMVLTNAYSISEKKLNILRELSLKYSKQLTLRISLDHYDKKTHEDQRGIDTFDKTLNNINKLVKLDLNLNIAGRSLLDENLDIARLGYQSLLDSYKIDLKLNSKNLIIFPEMHMNENVPEISMKCYKLLGVSASDLMCSNERMIIKRKGSKSASVVACTLIAYDNQFELGNTLMESFQNVYLNHTFCAKFCVLGGASCSG